MSDWQLIWRVGPVFVRAFLAVFVFAPYVEKRQRFHLRFILTLIVGTALSFATSKILLGQQIFLGETLTTLLRMAIVYGLVNVGTAVCLKGSLWTVMLIASSGYAVQDIVGHMKSLVQTAAGWRSTSLHVAVQAGIDLVLLGVVCGIIWFLIRDKKGHGEDYLDNRFKALLSLAVMFICLGMGRLTNGNPGRNAQAKLTEDLYAILVCSLLLVAQYGSTARARLVHDVDAMREMMHLQRVQFDANRDNVQLVNEKYHDINKLLNGLAQHVPENQIENLRTEISSYDAQANTGNEALDVVLTEKRLHCNARGFELTAMADGKALDFVEELDIYALFSNLLSNAMEAVEKLPETSERFITLKVSKSGNMVTIHEENPCTDEVIFEDGLPQTTGDPMWHGFGMRSMERIAEKYGGTLTAEQQGKLFLVDILLFSPEKES